MRWKTTSGKHRQMGLQKYVKQASSRKGVVDHDYTKNITTCFPPTQLDPTLEPNNETSHDNASKKIPETGSVTLEESNVSTGILKPKHAPKA